MKRRKEEECANPLFLQWLLEWKEEAAKQKKEPLKQCLGKAAKSLKEHKEVLYTGEDCRKLKYFGSGVCAMITKRLDQHMEGNGTPRKMKSPRTYVPKPGTGGEALLTTLYLQSKLPGYKGYMTKAELQQEAQPICDTSLSKAQAGTFYTAWNSMTKLVKEELVVSWSKPSRFRISAKGEKLVEAMQNSKKNNGNVNNTSFTTRADVTLLDSSDEDEAVQVRPKPHSLSNFALANIDDNFRSIPSTSKAQTERQERLYNFDNDNYYDQIKNIPSTSTKQSKSQERLYNFDNDNYYDQIKNIPSTSTKQPEFQQRFPSNFTEENFLSNVENIPPTLKSRENFQKFVFEPYTFDILLLVDVQETSGKAKQKVDETCKELRALEVNFEVRHLKLGDFLWIARCRNTKQEVVLPHIVERKRIDDLAQSIKDERYREQKWRMKNSGIKNRIYLIETYANNEHTVLDKKALFQASVSTMIRDGFIVQYTDSHQDSMSYLSILTKSLRNKYSGKQLICVEKEDLDFIDVTKKSERVMEFQKFNKDNAKSKHIKVKDMFKRQLAQIKGVSQEKATAIVEVFPTPKLLYTAMIDSDINGQELLSPLQYGNTNRQLGPVASKIIYQLYTKRVLE
ncbi:crossover junction endonuclease MUS81 [Leptopilina heterotoma]|uniref:crossover junction endonuclease MUS81 n=1 Tax=Leptopilina heterotoma TaxID=63436 RepID=UPI001CA90D97|nr:crossover junction endonuclease MUS81 [Leptopilina heterotoma]XP_043478697.1 crossover junction endonuclease MUS81 [Leptopilina heterotoma]XP_043478698.1 crossover junction endonuclease MUS81 [Leptopilina heterotoma]